MKLLVVAALALFLSVKSRAQEFKAEHIKKHIEFLASDDLEGRGTGSLGEIKAANYIAEQFKKAGLKPAGKDNSFFQPFQVTYSVEGNAHTVTGRNVIGFLDNGAAQTIVVGAHYDHLGKGYQSGSLSPDSKNKIHNGADDNASGTTGLIELAGYFSANGKNEKHNLLFMAFSGEELGLLGSKYFTESPTIALNTVSSMINMDMIGRLDDAKGVIISGWGTSPVWGKLLPALAEQNKIRYTVDSSGVGASDHTSFYLKNIPVVQFFTGSHGDYHKISDDADKINFNGEAKILKLVAGLIDKLDQEAKPEFVEAGNPHTARTTSNFKVTLGVMPDYSFQGKGLKIDGVSKGRPAEAAGILTGDIILKLAGKDIETIYDYMEILGNHEKGQKVDAVLLRGNNQKTVQVTF
jgi:Zn-dependent M28 family amino/carboxypeptidase